MLANEMRNLEKIKARQKREVKLMVESELKAQEIKQRNEERQVIAKQKEERRAHELALKQKEHELLKQQKEAILREKAAAEAAATEQRKLIMAQKQREADAKAFELRL
jgi:hypothetical protein